MSFKLGLSGAYNRPKVLSPLVPSSATPELNLKEISSNSASKLLAENKVKERF